MELRPTPSQTPPDFVGIGALKAGTTYLERLLRQHPEVAFPEFLKETDYFSRNFELGASWYRSLFGETNGRRVGEFSPTYLCSAEAVVRLHRANPDAKILVLLRDPVSRLVSQYRHWIQETGYAGDFSRFLTDHPGSLQTSRYAYNLAPWIETFGATSVTVVLFERLVRDPLSVFGEVCLALEVDPDFVPRAADEAANVTTALRFPRTYRNLKRVSRGIYARGGGRSVAMAKQLGAQRVFHRGATGPAAISVPASIVDLLGQDTRRLQQMVADDLGAWWNGTGPPG